MSQFKKISCYLLLGIVLFIGVAQALAQEQQATVKPTTINHQDQVSLDKEKVNPLSQEGSQKELSHLLTIHTGLGSSTSYSGFGFQFGIGYVGRITARLTISYGGIQEKASSALPVLGFQIFFREPTQHNFGIGFNYLSYEINLPPVPYQVKSESLDLIYKLDIGHPNAFELQFGLSFEGRVVKSLQGDRYISREHLSGIYPMVLLGLNYVFEVKK